MHDAVRFLHLAYVVKDMWHLIQRNWDENIQVLKTAHLAMVQYDDFDITLLGQLTPNSLRQMIMEENMRLLQREKMRINFEIPPEKSREGSAALSKYQIDLEKVTTERMKIWEQIFGAKVDFTKNGISLEELRRCF